MRSLADAYAAYNGGENEGGKALCRAEAAVMHLWVLMRAPSPVTPLAAAPRRCWCRC